MDIKQFESLNIDEETISRRSSDASDATTLIASPHQSAVIQIDHKLTPPTSMVTSPGYRMIVPPKQGLNVKPVTMTDLPYEILESIVSLVAGSPDREWQDVVFHLPRPRQKLVDPGPTNDIRSLMLVSQTLREVAGRALYSRLNWRDCNQGALRFMSERKVDHLARGQNIRLTYHDTGENHGPYTFDGTLTPIQDVYLRIFGSPEPSRRLFTSCHPNYCPTARQIIPQTLVVWQMNSCNSVCRWEANCQHFLSWNLTIAEYYHPYPIQNLIVRVGRLSAWGDEYTNPAKIQTWFRSFIKSRSVVFIVDNPYIWTTTKAGRKRDMRYNPEDNLHPWVSIFMKSLLEYSLGDYAKDITIVNIGSIRSETLGLAEEYWKIKADFKCERCYAEKEFGRLFQHEYDRRFCEQTNPGVKAQFKFISFWEYFSNYAWKGTVRKVDEKYYIHEFDERRYTKRGGYNRRLCHECDHPEGEVDVKEEIERQVKKDADRLLYYESRFGYSMKKRPGPRLRASGVFERSFSW